MSGKVYTLCAVLLCLIFAGSASAGSKTIIRAEADVDVFEGAPNETSSGQTVLSAGIGRGLREGRFISYLRFDLSTIPNSSLTNNISIDSGKLNLLAQSFGLAARGDRFFVTVSHCPETEWSESTMTWNSRASKDGGDGEYSIIIDGNDLPNVYSWDVTGSLARAKAKGLSKITFAIDAFRLEYNPREPVPGERFGPKESVGFVRFWSRERAKFGINAIPTLLVYHSSSPTAMVSFLNLTFALLSAIAVVAGLYGMVMKYRRRKSKAGK